MSKWQKKLDMYLRTTLIGEGAFEEDLSDKFNIWKRITWL